MNTHYRKSIVWLILAIYLVLAPVPLWNDGNLVLCIEDGCADCHDGMGFDCRDAVCEPAKDVCEKSCGYNPQILDRTPDACFCCIEIPVSTFTKLNTPLSRPHDTSGGALNVLAPSLPDSHPLLNKAFFSPSPNPHIISTQKTLRSVILII